MNIPAPFPDPEIHPLSPFLPPQAKLLMLGSFPPPRKRWSMDFFYPNLQNDMWRIFGFIFFQDKAHFLKEDKKAFDKELLTDFLNQKGIALYDSATVVRRLQDNASDKFLEIVQPTDIASLLRQLPDCQALVTTGQKATEILLGQFPVSAPRIGHFSELPFGNRPLRFYRMPSSSRAYPKSIEEKALFYEKMLREVGILA